MADQLLRSKQIIFALFLIMFLSACNSNAKTSASLFPPDDPFIGMVIPGKGKLVWYDDFDGNSLDSRKWNIETGAGIHYDPDLWGWGNMEKQWYQADNVRVANGKLIIEAKKQATPIKELNYTSGRITTAAVKDANTYEINKRKYITPKTGYVEARLKSPQGKGFWPCFWLIGANYLEYSGFRRVFWPACGEIDVFEADADNQNLVEQTIHYGSAYPDRYWFIPNKTVVTEKIGDGYHVYGVGFDKTGIRFYIDDELTAAIPFPLPEEAYGAGTASFYKGPGFAVQFNLAMGGYFLGRAARGRHDIVPADSVFSDDDWEKRCLMVDWVRVYKQ
jgi:beta-glucanase (GH16 family)